MPTRGSPLASSCASGCWASQSISALTSRPSASGESTVTVPPELPNPRLSHVSTLKPALRSAPTPTLPVDLVARGVRVGLPRAAPAVALEDRRRLPALRGGVEGEDDLGAVERCDGGVAGLGGGGRGEDERRGEEEGAHGSR